jgi:hypothetical protein
MLTMNQLISRAQLALTQVKLSTTDTHMFASMHLLPFLLPETTQSCAIANIHRHPSAIVNA